MEGRYKTYATLTGCSLRLYQFDVRITQAGEAAPSQNPRKNLTTRIPVGLLVAAIHISHVPQRRLILCQYRVSLARPSVLTCRYQPP